MGNEPLVEQETDSQVFLEDSQTETIECPNCMMTIPHAIYCPKCGFPTYSIINGNEEKKETTQLIEDELIEPTEQELKHSVSFSMVPMTRIPTERGDEIHQIVQFDTVEEGSNHATHTDQSNLGVDIGVNSDKLIIDRNGTETPPSIGLENTDDEVQKTLSHDEEESDFEAHVFGMSALVDEDNLTCRPDGATRDLMRELFNSANLMLWSIGQLLEGGMSEDNFSRMFKGYDERWRQCNALKLKSLQQAKDTRQLEEKLEIANVNLGELELRRSIGDLLDGEYEAKAPAYRWEINRLESECERRKMEINFLDDLGNVAPREELGRLEANAKRFLERLDEEDIPEHSKKTYKKVKRSLEEILQDITSET
ncbi:hypothetical protein MCGE09_00447 [Thaumarchaeota archaeon SCGC AB-539-E09]|nr:hypothetical protein MCGE09_00447 [Thaumarchaeota archaeon SCGC AB-539-E09]